MLGLLDALASKPTDEATNRRSRGLCFHLAGRRWGEGGRSDSSLLALENDPGNGRPQKHPPSRAVSSTGVSKPGWAIELPGTGTGRLVAWPLGRRSLFPVRRRAVTWFQHKATGTHTPRDLTPAACRRLAQIQGQRSTTVKGPPVARKRTGKIPWSPWNAKGEG